MNKTTWGGFEAEEDQTVVISTIGSEFDTAVAAYEGDTIPTLVPLAFNDDINVPGISSTHSLIQLDITKGKTYSVQFGSKTGATGTIFANVAVFPRGGGLTAQLLQLNGFTAPRGDYVCGYNAINLIGCFAPKFVLYNSTPQTLEIMPSSDLGPGVIAPAPFSLAPGAVATAEFSFDLGTFNTTTPRAISGHFTFTGRVNGAVEQIAAHRALIMVRQSGALPNTLRMNFSTLPVEAASVNEPVDFLVSVTNTGAQTAIGCVVRGRGEAEPMRTEWQLIDQSAAAVGITRLNVPANIPPGATQLFRVIVASQIARAANPTFAGNNQRIIECANTEPATIDRRTNFDFTARGIYDPADITLFSSISRGGALNVPGGGYSFFYAWFRHSGQTTTLAVAPEYATFFDETDPAKRFLTSICPTNPHGDCVSSPALSSTFTAVQNTLHIFKVFVQAPPVDPGYEPGWRRVYFHVNEVQPTGSSLFAVPVASHSVAVRMIPAPARAPVSGVYSPRALVGVR